MKVVILYRPKSEHGSKTEAFIYEFTYRYQDARLDVLDADSREGVAMADLYGIMSYPVILALRDDGSVLRSWEGDMLPLMEEVAYYTLAQ